MNESSLRDVLRGLSKSLFGFPAGSDHDVHPLLYLVGDPNRLPDVDWRWASDDEEAEGLTLRGELGDRVGNLLERYGNPARLHPSTGSPNCHDIAWYAAGLRDSFSPASPAYIGAVYDMLGIAPSRAPLEPEEGEAVLVHVVEQDALEAADPASEAGLLFNKAVHHSAVKLGTLDRHEICLWKNGNSGGIRLSTEYEMRHRYEPVIGKLLAPLYVSAATIKEFARTKGIGRL